MQNITLVYLILFCSSFIRSTFGFGDALVAMPLLALVVGLKIATPLVALVASTIGMSILITNWRRVQVQSAWRLIGSAAVGIPIGLVLLRGAYEGVLKIILAAVLIGFGAYSLARPRLPTLRGEKPAFVFGFIAGILGGAYNSNGPPVVIYGALKRWDPEVFRATLQGFLFPTSLFILAGHGLAGFWTGPVIRTYLYSLPLVLAAVYLGGRINRAFSTERFADGVYALLIGLGLLLLTKTVL
jgi:uncharacterized membrane protein YfcA